jgi:hypothetical protein
MGPARLEGYISRGMRKSFFNEKSGAERAAEMLLAKLKGEPFRTEYEMPVFNKIRACTSGQGPQARHHRARLFGRRSAGRQPGPHPRLLGRELRHLRHLQARRHDA